MIRLLLIAALLIAGARTAVAEHDAEAYRALNAELVARHIVPRYAHFAKMAMSLENRAEEACVTPSPARLEEVRKAALAAEDAWQSVQHIRFGPAEQDMRSSRLEFWPDVRNRTGRELDALLAAHDPGILRPDAFARTNVVVQGFPALERLLYEADGASSITVSDAGGRYRCALARAIAANISAIASAVQRAWTEGDGSYAAEMARAGGEFARYRTPREATLDLFKSLHSAVEVVADHKLGRPLGDSLQAARPKLAESWRSERSMENICRNLEAARDMYLGEDGSGNAGFSRFVREVAKDAPLDDLLKRAFTQTVETADSVEVPLVRAVSDPAERTKLETLKKEAGALKALLAQRLTAALAIPLGFNALDGD
jgi:predicted lipoprotein